MLLCLPECRAVYRTVHRLMAQAFLHNSDPQTCGTVDHIDGDPLNNTVGNLRWASRGLQSHNSRKRRGCISRYTHSYSNVRETMDCKHLEGPCVLSPRSIRHAGGGRRLLQRCRGAPVRSLCAPEFSPCFTDMSVIRYPGGKTRAIPTSSPSFPPMRYTRPSSGAGRWSCSCRRSTGPGCMQTTYSSR